MLYVNGAANLSSVMNFSMYNYVFIEIKLSIGLAFPDNENQYDIPF